MSQTLTLNPLVPAERSRTYHFAGGESTTMFNVTHLLVRPSGNHRLRTADGKLHIIPPVFLRIEIDSDEFAL